MNIHTLVTVTLIHVGLIVNNIKRTILCQLMPQIEAYLNKLELSCYWLYVSNQTLTKQHPNQPDIIVI